MTALPEILKAYDTLKREHLNGVLATVVKVHGQASCRPGSRMLMDEKGTRTGTFGDSALDGEVEVKRGECLTSGKILTLSFEVAAQGSTPSYSLLLEPIPTWEPSSHLEFIRRSLLSGAIGIIAHLFRADGEVRIHTGERVMVRGDGIVEKSTSNPFVNAALLDDCREVLQTHQSKIKRYDFTEGTVEAFIEVIEV